MRSEAVLIKKIVRDIFQKLYYVSSSDFDGLIGINSRIQHIESLLNDVTAERVRILGIWGMGGIGKSTLVGAFFNQNFAQFEGHCFLANTREESQKCGPLNLRKKLLAELLGDNNLNVNTPNLGPFIRSRLRQKKVLIVLDDMSDSQQIEFLGGEHDWFGPGSIIIITSRDRHVLNSGGVDIIYEVRELDLSEALSLFRRNAFKQKENKVVGDDHHHDDMELSSRVTNYCKGNPLALKVLGSFLCGRSKQEQQSALDKLERTPNVDIQRVLRVSFDGLDHEERGIFLDIACFFKGKNINEVKWLLDGCGFSTDIGIRVLVDKCLVVIQNETIQMHDLLQQMGQEIVCLESLDEPGERSRLWDQNDICRVLTKNTGTRLVKGIFLHMSETRSVKLTKAAFERMYNLRLLEIDGKVHLPEGLEYLPDALTYLHWVKYPLPYLPTSFLPENLVELELRDSLVERLWNGKQNLANLKKIDLCFSKNLISLPDLSLATNLEEMDLECCKSLIELPSSSVRHLHKLKILILGGCKSLGNLLGSICQLESLETLDLFECSSITKFPEVPPNIRELNLDETAIEEVPSSIQFLTRLTTLTMSSCKRLKNLSPSIWKLKNLGHLDLGGCSYLESFPEITEKMEYLQMITLSQKAIKELDESFACNLPCLEYLDLRGSNIQNIPTCNLPCLKYLDLGGSNIQNIPTCNLPCLKHLDLGGSNIQNIPTCNLPCLEYLDLRGSNIQNIPTAINQFTGLIELYLSDCMNLQSLPQLPMSIQLIEADNCRSLETVSTPFTTVPIRGGRREFEQVAVHVCRGIYFNFTNCSKLDRNAGKSIAADLELRLQILATISPERLHQKYEPDPYPFIRYPGSEIPDWFSHKSTGSSITIKLPRPSPPGWCNSGRFLGLAICAVADFKDHINRWRFHLDRLWNSKDKNGVAVAYRLDFICSRPPAEDDAMIGDSSHVLLEYGQRLEELDEYHGGVDEITFEFCSSEDFDNRFELKMWGIHLLYDKGGLSFSEEEEDDEPAPKRLKSI